MSGGVGVDAAMTREIADIKLELLMLKSSLDPDDWFSERHIATIQELLYDFAEHIGQLSDRLDKLEHPPVIVRNANE